jgi:hypothetical protein
MAKKTKTTKPDQRKIVALALLTVIFVAIGLLTYALQFTRKQLDDVSSVKIASLIVVAVESLTQPVPEDARTGERYIAAARLRLPPSDQMDHQLLYHYSPALGDTQSELTIASRTALSSTKAKVLGGSSFQATFDAVPELQACSRAFRATFAPATDNESPLTFEKKLADGRTIYVYADSGCEINRESLTEYLRQIDSY